MLARFLLDNKKQRFDLFAKCGSFKKKKKKLQKSGFPSIGHSACAETAVMAPNNPNICGFPQELSAIGQAFWKPFKNNKETEA